MQVIRPVGREAAAKKYDILSALMAHALAGDKHRQRMILRLMALITTRYNWQRDELSVGQREIARLWSVDERTVKREMARLRAMGWITVKRAGTRGRVSVLGINLVVLMQDTQNEWPLIGPDFVARLAVTPQPSRAEIVPFPQRPIALTTEGGIWGRAADLLGAEDPSSYMAWFSRLTELDRDGGCLSLMAPSKFHATYVSMHFSERILSACRRIDPTISRVRISD